MRCSAILSKLLIVSSMYKIIHHYLLLSPSAHGACRHASQSSSSAFECRTGSGGMASDILAKAPPVPLWASPASPPAGPFPDIPAAWTLAVSRQSTNAPASPDQREASPFRRMASLLKRSDMKSPPLDAAATAGRPRKQTTTTTVISAVKRRLEERHGLSHSRVL